MFSKKPKALTFQIASGWHLAGLFSSKYASIDRVRLLIRWHTFKMAAMMSACHSTQDCPPATH